MIGPSKLLKHFQSSLDESILLLKRLVELESYSLDKAGIDALAAFLAKEFAACGAEATILRESVRGNALKAVWRSKGSGKPVLVLGHLDTVWPRGTILERPFRVEGGKSFGPGIFDMKAGLLLCLLVCGALRDNHLEVGTDVLFFFTSDEEIGTDAGLPHLRSVAGACRAVLCLEPPLPGGMAKTSRKGVGTFLVKLKGISAHAGLDHDKGANAIQELSRLVLALHAMTDYGRGITVNVGTIRGGVASNVVPARAEAEVDFRFSSSTDGLQMENRIRSLRPFDSRCVLSIEGGINRPPLERSEAVIALYEKAKGVAAKLGVDLGEGASGGGSDGSFTAAMGIPTLDGLGVAGDGAHAAHEYVELADIPRRASLLCELVRALAE